jgi:DNA-binding protein YbaB
VVTIPSLKEITLYRIKGIPAQGSNDIMTNNLRNQPNDPTSRYFQYTFVLLLLLSIQLVQSAFVEVQRVGKNSATLRLPSTLFISFNWFSKSESNGEGDDDVSGSPMLGDGSKLSSSASSGMVGVAGVVDSMENFKRVQRVGKMTTRLTQELASTMVEGTAADGKVKVTMDCQQRPINVFIDENYHDSTGVVDLCTALTIAMEEAHGKSLDRMEEKMKNLYSELGLTTTN